MSTFAISPIVVLVLAGLAALLIVGAVQLIRRRRSGLFIFMCTLSLMILGAFALLMPLSMHSQATAMREEAEAERARMHAENARLAALGYESTQPGAGGRVHSHVIVEGELPAGEHVTVEADANDEYAPEVSATYGESVATIPSVEQTSREVRVETSRSRSRSKGVAPRPSRGMPRGLVPGRSEVLSGILLGGLVLAAYFFLNANTRGHYTWGLRIGSTVVFIASMVVVLLVGRHF